MLRLPPNRTPLGYVAMIALAVALSAGSAGADEGTARQAAPDSRSAEITLNVPLDALIFIDGRRTYNSGMTRRFVTPPLTPGHTYFYEVKVTWIDGSRAREITRHVSFRAGERIVLNYSQPNWRETARDLWLDPVAPFPGSMNYYYDILNAPYYPNPFYVFPGYRPYPR